MERYHILPTLPRRTCSKPPNSATDIAVPEKFLSTATCHTHTVPELGDREDTVIQASTWNHLGNLDLGLDCSKKLRRLRRAGHHKHGLFAMPSPFSPWQLLPPPFAVQATKISWDKNIRGVKKLVSLTRASWAVLSRRRSSFCLFSFSSLKSGNFSTLVLLRRLTMGFSLWATWIFLTYSGFRRKL